MGSLAALRTSGRLGNSCAISCLVNTRPIIVVLHLGEMRYPMLTYPTIAAAVLSSVDARSVHEPSKKEGLLMAKMSSKFNQLTLISSILEIRARTITRQALHLSLDPQRVRTQEEESWSIAGLTWLNAGKRDAVRCGTGEEQRTEDDIAMEAQVGAAC